MGSNLDTPEGVHSHLQDLLEEESTRRDVQTAIDLQERYEWDSAERLMVDLEGTYGWNVHHAREIAELAWTQMYAEKEGE